MTAMVSKMNGTFLRCIHLFVAILTLGFGERGRTQPAPTAPAAPVVRDPSEILVRGRGVEIQRQEVDSLYDSFEGQKTETERLLNASEKEFRLAVLLERMIFQKCALARATEQDRRKAEQAYDKFITDLRAKAGTPAALKREIARQGMHEAYFEQMKRQEALVLEVINREVRSKVNIPEAEIRKYYNDYRVNYERPDSYRVAHLLISTRDLVTGQDLTDSQKEERRRNALSLLERARKGEDFAGLVRQYSEDPVTRAKGGEVSLYRGKTVVEFDAAALALKPGQISDLVTTQFGYHIIKSIERKLADRIPLSEVSKSIQETLELQEVGRRLPDWTLAVRKELGIEYTPAAPKRAWVPEVPAKKLQ